jgi:hypothetical protein
MTLIRRTGPGDDFYTRADTRPEPEIVGAGSGR